MKFKRTLYTPNACPLWSSIGQPKVKNFLHFSKFLKRPQTECHAYTMRGPKLLGPK